MSEPHYGMPMNSFSGQTVKPSYTDPIMSIPSSANTSRTNDLVPYMSQVPPPRSYVPHIDPISDEMFDRYVQRWQNQQRPIGSTSQSGQIGSPQPVRSVAAIGPSGHTIPNQREVSTSTQPNSSCNFDKVCAEYKNDLANLLRENFGVDVRSKTHAYQKPYPTSFASVAYPAGFRLSKFVKFSGEDTRGTFEHISQYLAQLKEAGSINELKVLLFSLSLTGTAFSLFSSLAPKSIGSWEQLEQKFYEHFFCGHNEFKLSHLTSVR